MHPHKKGNDYIRTAIFEKNILAIYNKLGANTVCVCYV